MFFLLSSTAHKTPNPHPTPYPSTTYTPKPYIPFHKSKSTKTSIRGDSGGTDTPGNGDSPASGRTFASIQRDGGLFLPIREAPSLASATLAEGQKSPTGTSRPQPQKHAHRTTSKPEFLRFFAPFPLDFLPFRCIFSTTTSTRGERLHPLSPWDLTTMVIFLTFITPFSITVSSLISVIIINFEVVFPTLFKVFGCPSVVSL